MRKVLSFLIIVILAVCIWTGKDIVVYIIDGYKADKHKAQLNDWYEQVIFEQQVDLTFDGVEDIDNEAEVVTEVEVESVKVLPLEQLQYLNTDIKGWISIEGTNVNDPVVQTDNNDFYLTHNIHKEKSQRGAIFLDAEHTEDSDHIIIFGHHMKDDSMFGSLDTFMSDEIDVTQYPITLQLFDQLEKWEIYSIYIYKPEDQFFQYTFSDEENKQHFLDITRQKSVHTLSDPPSVEERLLTLVTCYYTEYDARLVIHAKPAHQNF